VDVEAPPRLSAMAGERHLMMFSGSLPGDIPHGLGFWGGGGGMRLRICIRLSMSPRQCEDGEGSTSSTPHGVSMPAIDETVR